MWKLIPTGQFKKDLKRYRNKPEKLASLKSVLDLLKENGEVPHKYDPHMLKSNYKGFMECHVAFPPVVRSISRCTSVRY